MGQFSAGPMNKAVPSFRNSLTRVGEWPASVAQVTETQCAPTGTVYRRSRVQFPDRPVYFVFGFHGSML